METLFRFANLAIVPFWALLVLLPRWRGTQLLVHGPIVALLLTPVYAYLLFFYGPSPEGAGMGSLYAVMTAFSAPHVVMAGWIHYPIFDLFVGAWEVRDSQRLGISHLLVIPCLIATLMIGPVGFLLYLVLRFAMRGVVELDDAPVQSLANATSR